MAVEGTARNGKASSSVVGYQRGVADSAVRVSHTDKHMGSSGNEIANTLSTTKRRRTESPRAGTRSRVTVSAKVKPAAGVSDVIGKVVDIPAVVFNVDIPDMYYRGVVKGKDKAHKGCVVVQFEEDGTRYWLPAEDVRRWLREMELSGRDINSKTFGAGSDEFAASVLTEILERRRDKECTTSGSLNSSRHGSTLLPEQQGSFLSPANFAHSATTTDEPNSPCHSWSYSEDSNGLGVMATAASMEEGSHETSSSTATTSDA